MWAIWRDDTYGLDRTISPACLLDLVAARLEKCRKCGVGTAVEDPRTMEAASRWAAVEICIISHRGLG
jgi:hypothetical protein